MKRMRKKKRLATRKDAIFIALSCAWLMSLLTFTVLLLDTFGEHCIMKRLWGNDQSGFPRSPFVTLEEAINASVGKIVYEMFSIREPFFISEEDRTVFLANVENVKTLGEQPTDQLQGGINVIENGTAHSDFECGWRTQPDVFKTPGKVKVKLKRYQRKYHALAPLLVPQSNTFQHFLDGVVPKIIQGGKLLQHQNVTVLLFRPWDRIVEEMLEKLGIRSANVEYYDGGAYWAKYIINICNTPPIHPLLWSQARLQLGAFENLQSSSYHQAWVVFLVRTKARNGGRHIVNQQEVTSFLEARYGAKARVYTGSRHLNETVEFFGSARIVIGVHGGAFYNMNFCPKQTAFVEIMPTNFTTGDPVPQGLAHTIIWKMAQLLQQPYWRLHERPLSNQGNVKIDLDKLARVLDIIDSRQRALDSETSASVTLISSLMKP